MSCLDFIATMPAPSDSDPSALGGPFGEEGDRALDLLQRFAESGLFYKAVETLLVKAIRKQPYTRNEAQLLEYLGMHPEHRGDRASYDRFIKERDRIKEVLLRQAVLREARDRGDEAQIGTTERFLRHAAPSWSKPRRGDYVEQVMPLFQHLSAKKQRRDRVSQAVSYSGTRERVVDDTAPNAPFPKKVIHEACELAVDVNGMVNHSGVVEFCRATLPPDHPCAPGEFQNGNRVEYRVEALAWQRLCLELREELAELNSEIDLLQSQHDQAEADRQQLEQHLTSVYIPTDDS